MLFLNFVTKLTAFAIRFDSLFAEFVFFVFFIIIYLYFYSSSHQLQSLLFKLVSERFQFD